MNKSVPLDVWAIKDYGVKKWYDSFTRLPVSEEEKYSLYCDLYDSYVDIICNQSFRAQNVMVILYKLVMEYHMLLYSRLTLQRLEENGLSILVNKDKRNFITHFSGQTIKESFIGLDTTSPSLFQVVVDKSIMAARRIKYNQSNKIFSVFRNSDDLISMGHPKGLLIDYATFQGKNIFMIQPNGFNKGYKDYDINKLADELVNAVLHVSKRYKISLTSYIVKYITSVAYNSIERAYRALYVFEQYLKKIPPTSILVPAFGRFDARVLSIAGKNTGHRIVGSTHGGNVGFYRHSAWYNVDMLCCDDYLVPTRNAA